MVSALRARMVVWTSRHHRGSHSISWRRTDWPVASLVISTLEALAVLVSLKLQFGEEPRPRPTKLLISPTVTDNHGDGAALNKLMATQFPASAVVMELARYIHEKRRACGRLQIGRRAVAIGKRIAWPTDSSKTSTAQNPGQLGELGMGGTSSSTRGRQHSRGRVPEHEGDACDA